MAQHDMDPTRDYLSFKAILLITMLLALQVTYKFGI